MIIDLRSDTVTKPTKEMLEYMFQAEVGDEVYDEDPTIDELEEKAAQLFGKEAGLFCPSGTMTNQIAVKASTQPQQEVICHKYSHIYNYEGGGLFFNSGVSVKLVDGDGGRFTSAEVVNNINPDDVHYPETKLVTIENTANRGGGACYDIKEVEKISTACKENDLLLHLDGARIFNALVESGETASQYGGLCDSISICLSKGLGAPVGSVLLGTKEFIKKSNRIRKALGGGMRQAGYLAAAGVYALDHNIDRLKDDHGRAKKIGEMIKELSFAQNILPVYTNMIFFDMADGYSVEKFLEELAKHDIKADPMGPNQIRMVTHLDFNDDMLEELDKTLKSL
ncbi:MAG: threonine aldolase [Bacteroidetes bacterium]|nr:aminotransferase class I/II-fold pyridoxal phosphate-dependent enzyme [Bacteroidia bacterium]PCH67487.1 MAG: threonine aldolase [Bacteroidota bacterium]